MEDTREKITSAGGRIACRGDMVYDPAGIIYRIDGFAKLPDGSDVIKMTRCKNNKKGYYKAGILDGTHPSGIPMLRYIFKDEAGKPFHVGERAEKPMLGAWKISSFIVAPYGPCAVLEKGKERTVASPKDMRTYSHV